MLIRTLKIGRVGARLATKLSIRQTGLTVGIVAATRGINADCRFLSTNTRVTIEMAKTMPKRYSEMPNDILLTMAVMGDQDAREERLIREIMSVDNVSWEDAQKTFQKMVVENRRGLFVSTLPYKTGIAVALVAGKQYHYFVIAFILHIFFTTLTPGFHTSFFPENRNRLNTHDFRYKYSYVVQRNLRHIRCS